MPSSIRAAALLFAAMATFGGSALAQQPARTQAPPAASNGPVRPAPGTVPVPGSGRLFLSATFGGAATTLVSGVRWRIFQERADANNQRVLVTDTSELAPSLTLPDGDYIVHASYGLAAVTRRIVIASNNVNERIPLNAGALKISGRFGEAEIQPNRLKIDIYVPEGTDLTSLFNCVRASVRDGIQVFGKGDKPTEQPSAGIVKVRNETAFKRAKRLALAK
jgi:hypothetical protein